MKYKFIAWRKGCVNSDCHLAINFFRQYIVFAQFTETIITSRGSARKIPLRHHWGGAAGKAKSEREVARRTRSSLFLLTGGRDPCGERGGTTGETAATASTNSGHGRGVNGARPFALGEEGGCALGRRVGRGCSRRKVGRVERIVGQDRGVDDGAW